MTKSRILKEAVWVIGTAIYSLVVFKLGFGWFKNEIFVFAFGLPLSLIFGGLPDLIWTIICKKLSIAHFGYYYLTIALEIALNALTLRVLLHYGTKLKWKYAASLL